MSTIVTDRWKYRTGKVECSSIVCANVIRYVLLVGSVLEIKKKIGKTKKKMMGTKTSSLRLLVSVGTVLTLIFHSKKVEAFNINDNSISPSLNAKKNDLSRQEFLRNAIAGGCSTIIAGIPINCQAETFIGGPPMIQQWPSLQYLVPLYTFQFALDRLSQNLRPGSGAEGIRQSSQLIDQFFAGGFLSNGSVYRGLCAVYIQEIQYDDPDRRRVNEDRMERLQYCDKSVDALKAMQKPLRQLSIDGADVASDSILALLEEARTNTQSFLSQIPKRSLDDVSQWLERVNRADSNNDGKLQNGELDALNGEDRKLYLVVGDLIG